MLEQVLYAMLYMLYMLYSIVFCGSLGRALGMKDPRAAYSFVSKFAA